MVEHLNSLLDELIPPALQAKKLSRQNCLYMYAGFGELVMDIKTGKLTPWHDWDAGDDFIKLRVELDPATSYISDLDAYDELKRALKRGAPDEMLEELASSYWCRVIPLPDFLRCYEQNKGGILYLHPEPAVPSDYRRIEIMVAEDIPATHIQVL